jgi:hypothetical protein
MTILTDCDGVLLDWEAQFHPWMKRKGYRLVDPSAYEIHNQYIIPYDRSKELVQQFSESATIGFLPPFRDAIHSIANFARDNHVCFHCISSMGKDLYANTLRIRNIEMFFGKNLFERFAFLDCGAPKNEILKEYEGSGYIWLEDKPENAEIGLRYGLRPFLFTHTYNKQTAVSADITRVTYWSQLFDILSKS